jgi:glycosyltransferase involved in cell wall biosynthesis
VKKRPRILFIVPSSYESLKRKGTHVTFDQRTELGFFERVFTYHPVAPSTSRFDLDEVHTITEFGLDTLPFSAASRLLRLVQRPFRPFRVITSLCRTIGAQNIDLIRANDPHWMGIYAFIVSRLTGRPFVVSLHADYQHCKELITQRSAAARWPLPGVSQLLERFIMRRAGLVLPIRESLGTLAIAAGVPSERTRVIPHGFDFDQKMGGDRLAIRRSFGIPDAHCVFSFAGRFSRENYIDDIVEATRRVAYRHRGFTVVLAGGGSEFERVARAIEADPLLSEAVKLTGYLSRVQVFHLRSVSDASLCLMGGFSLIEACAAESSPIAYDVQWHHELVQSSRTGFLIPEGQVEAVAKAMETVIANPFAARRLGKEARRLAKRRHRIEHVTRIKRKAYLDLLKSSRPSSTWHRLSSTNTTTALSSPLESCL